MIIRCYVCGWERHVDHNSAVEIVADMHLEETGHKVEVW